MDEEKNIGPPAVGAGMDFESAKEAAREATSEAFRRRGGVHVEECGGFYLGESLAGGEPEQGAEELLKELNARANEIYRRKKLERPE